MVDRKTSSPDDQPHWPSDTAGEPGIGVMPDGSLLIATEDYLEPAKPRKIRGGNGDAG